MLPSVRKAEQRIYEAGMNHEYAPIGGEAPFSKLSANLALGEGKLSCIFLSDAFKSLAYLDAALQVLTWYKTGT